MRRLPLVVLTFCTVAGQAPLDAQQVTEVGGRSLEYWIGQIPSRDQSKSASALGAVLLFGSERAYSAVPVILERLKKHTPGTPVDTSVRVHGAMSLGIILGEYREAETKHIREAVTILKRLLADNQSIVRFRAAQALGRIGADARDAIPEVISVVKDPSTYETRQAAAIALGSMAFDKKNGPTVGVLNALFGALGDGSVQVRMAAVQSLTFLGGAANPTVRLNQVKALDPVAYKDAEPTVQIWAHMAVMSITKSISRDRLDRMSKMLQHADFAVRIQAAQALGTIGPDAKSAIPGLTTNLTDPDPYVLGWSIWALGRMGPSAAGTMPTLQTLKADMKQPEAVRKIAAEAIDYISGKKK